MPTDTLWHHAHNFGERDGGTLCLDRVRYRPRGSRCHNNNVSSELIRASATDK